MANARSTQADSVVYFAKAINRHLCKCAVRGPIPGSECESLCVILMTFTEVQVNCRVACGVGLADRAYVIQLACVNHRVPRL